ncbi:MAG: divergent polysaccharide deacetylase family protein [Candidatus Thiodiazotropha sp. (ex Ctena orbiculata)]|nr:divergent polysaccharide deacetylase family protein [Candidatus Thiodiazotropha taylori]MBT2997148.1 divergent polysaccharide deacetylase family protein [Candidatus Thiodiazotropha taylori]MBT3001301.1 divergent polysaccharide deacetylase family protein [Candidatus Thiodiazotropha taylori]MBV2107145.1 divergent polysaccharide deacetylase family protein [Candidatus Thiodiazotropha taylori]MBV2111673.1 divergent polysaccharide deacetylase family protein [Candidatus Thiodiazotropha taylori]
MHRYALLLCMLWLLAAPSLAAADGEVQPPAVKIALIIDDLGNQLIAGEQALALPGALTYAFLPQTPFAWQLASRAHELNKEVMLHQPMESDNGNPLGNGALTLDMSRERFAITLRRNLASVPYVVGVNNHMGSLLTRDPTAMRWLMDVLRANGLYYIDSRTTDATVAERTANRNLVAASRRHVFLDNLPQTQAIRAQLRKLIEMARDQGGAIGIAHPYPETLALLRKELPRLERQGVELVPVSQLVYSGRPLWHAYSSPSPKDAKSSKQSPSRIY